MVFSSDDSRPHIYLRLSVTYISNALAQPLEPQVHCQASDLEIKVKSYLKNDLSLVLLLWFVG